MIEIQLSEGLFFKGSADVSFCHRYVCLWVYVQDFEVNGDKLSAYRVLLEITQRITPPSLCVCV